MTGARASRSRRGLELSLLVWCALCSPALGAESVGQHRFVFIGTGLPGRSVEVRGSPHAVYLLDEGGKLLPLTPARIGATHVIWDPKDKALLYATNEGGDERFCRWCRIAWPPHAAEEPCRDVLTFRGFTGPLSF